MFHPRCGRCVVLSNGNRTASRINPTQEFNCGLVFSLDPLKDNELFEVRLSKKLSTWSGSLEIGVTVCNPDIIDIPITATDLRGGTWIMLGQGVLRDGRSLHEAYGIDLDKLVEGDRVGVRRTSLGDLHIYVNGVDQGVAATNVPSIVYAVVDMYGKCAEICVSAPTPSEGSPDESPNIITVIRDSNVLIESIPPPQTDSFPSVIESVRDFSGRVPLAPTASEEGSLTEPNSGSALTNHVVNISIANSLLTSDSNIIDDEQCLSERLESMVDMCQNMNDRLNSLQSNSSREQHQLNPGNARTEVSDAVNGVSNIYVSASNGSSQNLVDMSYSCLTPPPAFSLNLNNSNNLNQDGTVPDSNLTASLDQSVVSTVERLKFHQKCGTLIKLSNGGRSAERRRPLDEFNNGVVMSNRALRENELFEIRIDRLVDKWSGSIEVGVTTHNPSLLEFPATMTNMRSGTIMMSGTGILTNGKGTLREYGDFNLDELKEGDRIGMMIKTGRNLHYYINGIEQGVAATCVPDPVWSVVDLYGMTVRVTIVDRDEREEQNLITRRNTFRVASEEGEEQNQESQDEVEYMEPLLFYPRCGTYARVFNGGLTAHRPNSCDDFNNGVVLTNRPLRAGETFEVKLDKLEVKWAGSLEIGLTTHAPTELEFPSTMTNVRSGTWLMASSGITHNGTTIVETYGCSLDRLKVDDRVGVVRKPDGSLHFYINGEDQGLAATNLPETLYGVVDLYGQAAQVTISSRDMEVTPDAHQSSNSSSTVYSDLRFHLLHGRNAKIIKGGLVAQRPNGHGEFNDAIVMSNRQLHEGEMFEVMIERMVDRWSGSLEAGVTAIDPEQIDFPSTMTDIDYATWMLSGSSVMRNGATTMNNYPCDLDALGVGTRIGMMRHSDSSLHYYVNGEDMGAACTNLPMGLWAVIDLYGQCAQVSIVHNPIRLDQSLLSVSQYLDVSRLSLQAGAQTSQGSDNFHKWSKICGANISLTSNNMVATRVRHFNHGIVLSENILESDELFEIKLKTVLPSLSGSLRVGLFSCSTIPTVLPSSMESVESGEAWYVDGSSVHRSGQGIIKANYGLNFSRLVAGNRVGVRRTVNGDMRISINGEDIGIAASNIPKKVYACCDLFGCAESAQIVSLSYQVSPSGEPNPIAAVSQDSLEVAQNVPQASVSREKAGRDRTDHSGADNVASSHIEPIPTFFNFHEMKGRNVELSSDRTVAVRLESFNQGVVFSSKPLSKSGNDLFQVRLGSLNPRWSSSLMIGVTTQNPEKISLSGSAFDIKKNAWIICGDSVFHNGRKIKGRYGPDLDSLSGGTNGHIVGVLVDEESRLHLYVNGVDQGVAAKEIPQNPYVVLDLYGQCQEVVLQNASVPVSVPTVDPSTNRKNLRNTQQHQLSLHSSYSLNHNLNLQQQLYSKSNSSQSHSISNPISAQSTSVNRQQGIHSTNSSENPNVQSNLSSQRENQPIHCAENLTNDPSVLTKSNQSLNSSENEMNYSNTISTNLSIQRANQSGSISESQTTNLLNATPTNHDRTHNQGPEINESHPTNEVDCPPSKGKIKEERVCVDTNVIKNCEYQNMCSRFMSSISLPGGYFDSDGNLCFCETCHKIRGGEAFHTKGNPPKQYAQPIGWCRFGLVTSVGENRESWHMAYHGTRLGAIRRMLDRGELLFQGELDISAPLCQPKTKEDAGDGSVLCFSPAIEYAANDAFAEFVHYVDPSSKKPAEVRTILQIAVEPGSYKVCPPSHPFVHSCSLIGDNPRASPLTDDGLEWVTKERGATQLLAVLVQIKLKEK